MKKNLKYENLSEKEKRIVDEFTKRIYVMYSETIKTFAFSLDFETLERMKEICNDEDVKVIIQKMIDMKKEVEE